VLIFRCQDVEGDNLVRAGGVNVDQPSADVWNIEDVLAYKQSQQVIYQEGMGIDQAATISSSDILIQTPFQELGFSFPRQADDVKV
jgi:hypothetical protein